MKKQVKLIGLPNTSGFTARGIFDANFCLTLERTQQGIPQQGRYKLYTKYSAYLKIQRILVFGLELLVPLFQHLALQRYLLLHGL